MKHLALVFLSSLTHAALPGSSPHMSPAQTVQYGILVGQEDDAVAKMTEQAVACQGYLFQRSTGRLELRIPSDSTTQCLPRIVGLGKVYSKNVDMVDLEREFSQNQTKLTAKTQLLNDYFSLLDSSDAESYVAVSQGLQRLIAEIEELKTAQAQLVDRSQWTTVTLQLQLPKQQRRQGTEASPFPWVRALDPIRLLQEF